MKIKSIGLAVVAIMLLAAVVGKAASEYYLFMPLVFKQGPTATVGPTATATKKPPTVEPEPTATPILQFEPGESWVWIGAAWNQGDYLRVVGINPGFCYFTGIDHYENDGKMVVLRSWKIKENTWWCTKDEWPQDTWPPPEYALPPSFPPEFGYGDVFSITLDDNAKQVCGYCDGCNIWNTTSCKDVN